MDSLQSAECSLFQLAQETWTEALTMPSLDVLDALSDVAAICGGNIQSLSSHLSDGVDERLRPFWQGSTYYQ